MIASKGIKDGGIEKSRKHYARCGFPWKICKYSTVDYVESREQTVGHGNPIRAKRSQSFLFARPRHGHAMQISVVCTLCNNFMEIADPARNFETHLARVIRAQTYRKMKKIKKKGHREQPDRPVLHLKGILYIYLAIFKNSSLSLVIVTRMLNKFYNGFVTWFVLCIRYVRGTDNHSPLSRDKVFLNNFTVYYVALCVHENSYRLVFHQKLECEIHSLSTTLLTQSIKH